MWVSVYNNHFLYMLIFNCPLTSLLSQKDYHRKKKKYRKIFAERFFINWCVQFSTFTERLLQKERNSWKIFPEIFFHKLTRFNLFLLSQKDYRRKKKCRKIFAERFFHKLTHLFFNYHRKIFNIIYKKGQNLWDHFLAETFM